MVLSHGWHISTHHVNSNDINTCIYMYLYHYFNILYFTLVCSITSPASYRSLKSNTCRCLAEPIWLSHVLLRTWFTTCWQDLHHIWLPSTKNIPRYWAALFSGVTFPSCPLPLSFFSMTDCTTGGVDDIFLSSFNANFCDSHKPLTTEWCKCWVHTAALCLAICIMPYFMHCNAFVTLDRVQWPDA